MAVDEKRKVGLVNEDRLPVGLRVLAVDDDLICLKVLESLLRKCQYHVETTNQSLTALKMLRENRDKFDIVISDVNMPDMDGFKLLEHVGIEMDIPVIMLSSHGDKELVYKGVTHGAVDYLLKPVRIEELKNIWQHVIRKQRLFPKDQRRSSNQGKDHAGAGEDELEVLSSSNLDQNGGLNRKRKEQNEEEEEETDENGQENDEPGTQKKPRVVWSVELHRKFVASVNQLGFEKAVPKKILDLMNVEGLTRENVASHLQKYRLYLKRISNAASQQASMVAAFGSKDKYLRTGSFDGFGDFHTLSGPGRLSSTTLTSYQPGGMLGRLNSPSGLPWRGIASSGLLPQSHSPTLTNSVNNLAKLQPGFLSGNQGTNLFQGNPSSLESNQLQNKSITLPGDFNHGDTSGFMLANSFQDNRVNISGLANNMSTEPTNPLMLQVKPQQSQSRAAFATQSSLTMPSLNQQSFDVGVCGSSNFLDHNRSNDNWPGAVQLSKFPTSSMPLSENFGHDSMPTNNLRDNISSTSPHIGNSTIDFGTSSAITGPFENSRVDLQGQAGFIGNVVQNMNYTSRQRWDDHSQDFNSNFNNSVSPMNSLVSSNGIVGSLRQNIDQRRTFDASSIGQLSSSSASVFQHTEAGKSNLDPKMRSNEDFLLEQTKPQNGFMQNSYESLDDIMNSMIKRDPSESMLMDGDFGFDPYSLGSCM